MSEASFNKIENGLPTVGRIVHFFTSDKSKHSNGLANGPYAAIVTQVFPGQNKAANLKVFPPFKTPYDEGSVALHDPVHDPERYWCWPPRV